MPLMRLITEMIALFFSYYQNNRSRILSEKGRRFDENVDNAFPVFHKIWIALCILGIGVTWMIIFEETRDNFFAGVLCVLVLFPSLLIYITGLVAYYMLAKLYIFLFHRSKASDG